MAQEITRSFVGGDFAHRLDVTWKAHGAAEKDGDAEAAESLRAEYEQIKADAEAEAAASNRVVTLRALSRRKWRDLKAKHPARSGDDVDPADVAADRVYGINVDTAEDDLVYASLSSPKFESRVQFDEWADDVLSSAEWHQVVVDALSLAREANFDPKSLPSSVTRSDAVR